MSFLLGLFLLMFSVTAMERNMPRVTWRKMRDMRRAESLQVIPVQFFLDQLIPTTHEWSQLRSVEPWSQLPLIYEQNMLTVECHWVLWLCVTKRQIMDSLMKCKPQGPSLVKAPCQALREALAVCSVWSDVLVKFVNLWYFNPNGLQPLPPTPLLFHHKSPSCSWHCRSFSYLGNTAKQKLSSCCI